MTALVPGNGSESPRFHDGESDEKMDISTAKEREIDGNISGEHIVDIVE